jgi:predicted GNAT superfamily acetyltransferase
MISYTQADGLEELKAVLALQSANLHDHLSKEQIETQGFLTISHSLELLGKMSKVSAQIIAKANDQIVGFCLSMTQEFENEIPILVPMFEMMNNVSFQNKKLKDYHYITVGQVCVADGFRGQSIFDGLYSSFRNQFETDYEMAVTEISIRNTRSLAAHHRVGFVPLEQYTAPNGEVWQIVVWDWRD